MTKSLTGLRLVLGVDRLDYSKGIIQRINGFDRFLEDNPEWRSHVTCCRSRQEVDLTSRTTLRSKMK